MGVLKAVTIHTDGACQGNPGPGGWAAVLTYGRHTREIAGGEPATTNNRMELRAAIEGLRALKEPCRVEFYTDSEYLRQGITAWIHGWKARGWRTKARTPVRNQDLWQALDAERTRHTLTWHWLKGHAGHSGNERCDELAGLAIERIRKQFNPAQLAAALRAFQDSERAATPPPGPNLIPDLA